MEANAPSTAAPKAMTCVEAFPEHFAHQKPYGVPLKGGGQETKIQGNSTFKSALNRNSNFWNFHFFGFIFHFLMSGFFVHIPTFWKRKKSSTQSATQGGVFCDHFPRRVSI